MDLDKYDKAAATVRITIDDEDEDRNQRRKRKQSRRENVDEPTMLTAPSHVHGNEWKDMLSLVDIFQQPKTSTQTINSRETNFISRSRANTRTGREWIKENISKRECSCFISTQKYMNKCGCGLALAEHSTQAKNAGKSIYNSAQPTEDCLKIDDDEYMRNESPISGEGTSGKARWAIRKHTVEQPTDAYGTITFEGGGHNSEAKYARVAFDTSPDALIKLLRGVWKLSPPKVIITLHGGLNNFDLQPKLSRALRRGFMKAAQSTETWIITTGVHQGVTKHLCEALTDLKSNRKHNTKVQSIGIAPWGLLKKRNRLIGEDSVVKYNMTNFSNGRLAELDESHTHFLLADNGTAGRYGAEIVVRRRFEAFLATGTAPVVCVVVEGGAFSVKAVHDYLTVPPYIPVVVCDGSGRASDLIAFTHQYLQQEEHIPESVHIQLLSLARSVFDLDDIQAGQMLRQITHCAEAKKLLAVFRLGEGVDVDHAIFSALLKGHNMTPLEQFRLALAWDREDIARKEIFEEYVDWDESSLQEALMDTFVNDKPQFVHLILERGVAIESFLTFDRLEKLYNTEQGPPHTLRKITGTRRFTLPRIGQIMENLIGSNYNSNYTSDEFLARYSLYKHRNKAMRVNGAFSSDGRPQALESEDVTNAKGEGTGLTIASLIIRETNEVEVEEVKDDASMYKLSPLFLMPSSFHLSKTLFTFERPFHELLIWAVLTKKRRMALLMWKHGTEGLAKALIAARLYKGLSLKAAEDYMEIQLRLELRQYAEEFQDLATELLAASYKVDDEMTQYLLTYELTHWGGRTCLNLAALDDNKDFMKHPCPQALLTELWNGGMQIRSKTNWLVVGALAFPPLIFALNYKSKEEIRKQPHTAAQHDDEEVESDSSLSSDSSISSDSSDLDSDADRPARKASRASSVGRFMNAAHRSFGKGKREEDKEHQAIHHLAAHVVPAIFTTGSGMAPSNGATKSRSGTQHKVQQHKRKERSRKDSTVSEARKRSNTGSTSRVKREGSQSRGRFNHIDLYEAEDKEPERMKKTPISWTQKLYEFYTAPITVYWLWTAAFTVFQILLVYILLLKTEANVRWSEFYVLAYVIVFGIDLIRKFMYYEDRPFSRKFTRFFVAFKNGTSLIAVIIHVIAFFMRLSPTSMQTGRVIIIMNSVLWSFKMLDLLWVHRALGPYITTASEMIPRTMSILVMLFVVLLSFGLVRQSITYPNEEWDWLLVRNIFLKPYYMLYGEVYAAEIDLCGDNMWAAHMEQGVPISQLANYSDPEHCVPGHWVSPLYMVVYMLIATVLLMNTLVACCTYVYEQRVTSVRDIWLFERYGQVMEYHSKPCLPPPLTIISHIWLLFRYLKARTTDKDRRKIMDNALKVFLTEDRLNILHRFESECLEDMEKDKEWKKDNSPDENITKASQRSEEILNKISTVTAFETSMREIVRDIEERISALEKQRKEEINDMRRMTWNLEKLLSTLTPGGTPVTTPSMLNYPRHVPQVVVVHPTEEMDQKTYTLDDDDEESQEVYVRSGRYTNSSNKHRHHNEYTTIADGIQGPTTRNSSNRQFVSRRRQRTESGRNSILLSVSEGDEHHHSDVE